MTGLVQIQNFGMPLSLIFLSFYFSLQRVLVHTSETTRLQYFIELLLEKGQPLMLVGNAGVGKTVFVGDILAGLSEAYIVSHVPFNYYTTSAALQSKCSSCLYLRNEIRNCQEQNMQPKEMITFARL